MSQNQRMILAVVLSIVFFVVYDMFFVPKTNLQDTNETQAVQTNQNVQNSKETILRTTANIIL